MSLRARQVQGADSKRIKVKGKLVGVKQPQRAKVIVRYKQRKTWRVFLAAKPDRRGRFVKTKEAPDRSRVVLRAEIRKPTYARDAVSRSVRVRLQSGSQPLPAVPAPDLSQPSAAPVSSPATSSTPSPTTVSPAPSSPATPSPTTTSDATPMPTPSPTTATPTPTPSPTTATPSPLPLPSPTISAIALAAPSPADDTVDPGSRSSVVSAWNDYLAHNDVPSGYNGDPATCTPGTTTTEFKLAVRDRVNWYRNMVGLPDVQLDLAASDDLQQTALMMAAQEAVSHYPDENWACHTDLGATGAAKSNLAPSVYGPAAITAYVDDWGDFNTPVGHRQWILNPKLLKVATGDVYSPTNRRGTSNALRVIWPEQAQRPNEVEYVAWPNAGYVPHGALPHRSDRWSFSLSRDYWTASAPDFSDAQVVVTTAGGDITPQVVNRTDRYGDYTLVWEMPDIAAAPDGPDRFYRVTVTDVLVDGVKKNYSYVVTLIG